MESLTALMKALSVAGEGEKGRTVSRRATICAARRAAVLARNAQLRKKADEESGETLSGLEECSMRVVRVLPGRLGCGRWALLWFQVRRQ
jgi:hypothetical protein